MTAYRVAFEPNRIPSGRSRLLTAVSALLAGGLGCAPQAARADCQPASTDGASVLCTNTVNSFAASGLGSLTVTGQNANFNGAFTVTDLGGLTLRFANTNFNSGANLTVERTATVNMTGTNTNFQALTFIDVGTLNLGLTGGNVNGALTVTRGGDVTIDADTNLNQPLTLDLSGQLGLTIRQGRSVNTSITRTGTGTSNIVVGAKSTAASSAPAPAKTRSRISAQSRAAPSTSARATTPSSIAPAGPSTRWSTPARATTPSSGLAAPCAT
jgi:hypothetical protein